MNGEELNVMAREQVAKDKRQYCIEAIKRLIGEVENDLGDHGAAMDLLQALTRLERR